MTTDTLIDLKDKLTAAGYTAHFRESAAANGLEFYIPVELTDGAAYTLGWFMDHTAGRIRRLLDYDGWLPVQPTLDSILPVIEESERKRTRRAWPAQARYHAAHVIRPMATATVTRSTTDDPAVGEYHLRAAGGSLVGSVRFLWGDTDSEAQAQKLIHHLATHNRIEDYRYL